MTFNDLEAVIDLMKEPNFDLLGDLTDEQLIALKRNSALITLTSDVLNDTGIGITDTAAISEIVTKYEWLLNMALTYKQLQLYYYEINDVAAETLTNFRYVEYRDLYNDQRRTFGKFEYTNTETMICNSINVSYG